MWLLKGIIKVKHHTNYKYEQFNKLSYKKVHYLLWHALLILTQLITTKYPRPNEFFLERDNAWLCVSGFEKSKVRGWGDVTLVPDGFLKYCDLIARTNSYKLRTN